MVIHNIIEPLVKKGHDVTLFATKDSETSAKLEYVFEKGLYDMQVPWHGALGPLVHYDQAFKLYEKGNFDIVHVHMSSQTDLILLPYLVKLKKPYVMTLHSPWPYDRFTWMDAYYLGYYGPKVKAVTISKSAIETVLPKQFMSDGYAYNGTDMKKYIFNAAPKGDYFTWIGRIDPVKGLHEAIAAVKKAGAKFYFAGSVDKFKPGSEEYFEQEIKPHVDGKQIKYFGPADVKMKNELVGNAKAFLNPVLWDEPFGLVMVESMAMGTPVIAYKRGSIPELIKDSVTGYIVNDIDSMVAAMDKVDAINRADCRKWVEANFSAEASAEAYLKIFRRTLAEFNSGKEKVRKKLHVTIPKFMDILEGPAEELGFPGLT